MLSHLRKSMSFALTFMIAYFFQASYSAWAQDDARFVGCNTMFTCGNISNIGYPFWGSNRPRYCGYPDFELNCSSQAAEINIQGLSHQVLHIVDNSSTLYLAIQGSSDTQNLGSYYGCPTIPSEVLPAYGLTSGSDTVGYYVTRNLSEAAFANLSATIASRYGSCNGIVFVKAYQLNMQSTASCQTGITNQSDTTVSAYANCSGMTVTASYTESTESNLTKEDLNLFAALERGFGLVGDANSSYCDGCKDSGGACGYNESTSSFTCFCSDQPYDFFCGSESRRPTREHIELIIPLAVTGLFVILICVFIVWRKMPKYRDQKKSKSKKIQDYRTRDQLNLQELPIFHLQELVTATNNFDLTNKLGQGGFGPVYRGTLPDGQEIAVKRLSKASGQGLEELKNEVSVISKLQHRNLVRILGCCIEEEEKLLVYEYMPNKSLDAFLFDPTKQSILDWKKRFNIIQGICRGLVYLHKDSRLRTIHRDIKASNILLDKELNAKISDFGMARIFGGNENEAKTRKVVGTCGYISPEYAIEGLFSEKSDVFSFGVLLLEIISGRKNTDFYENEQALSLIGYVWKLWNECNLSAIIESTIFIPCFREEIFRCIHVGLLCVQEFARDRPDASTVLSMLNSEIIDLPTPKKPAFTERHHFAKINFQQNQKNACSVNCVTITVLEGR